MSGQPSPYSTPSDDQRDAARWRRFVRITQSTGLEMTQDEWACWVCALRGGRIADDLNAKIDALLALDAAGTTSNEASRGGYAGAQQE